METVSRDAIKEVMSDVGLDDEALREDYTGRAMFGDDPCFGISFETDPECFEFFVVLGEVGGDFARKLARNARSDGMGRRMIVYFPRYTLDD